MSEVFGTPARREDTVTRRGCRRPRVWVHAERATFALETPPPTPTRLAGIQLCTVHRVSRRLLDFSVGEVPLITCDPDARIYLVTLAGSGRPTLAAPGDYTVGHSNSTRNGSLPCSPGSSGVNGPSTVCRRLDVQCCCSVWRQRQPPKCNQRVLPDRLLGSDSRFRWVLVDRRTGWKPVAANVARSV